MRHAQMSTEEAKAIFAVNLSYDRCDLVEDRLGFGVEDSLSDTFHVRWYSVHAMSVDTTEVSLDQAVCDDDRVRFWRSIADEDAAHKGAGIRGIHVDL